MSYYEKYLKYKKKYLDLKNLLNLQNIQKGGDKPIIRNIDRINLFTNPEMEAYLNPIYGLILSNTGFIPNLYHLYKSGFIEPPDKMYNYATLINKVCNEITGSIQPTNEIRSLKPIDFGRYIGLKYVNMQLGLITISESKGILYNPKYNISPGLHTRRPFPLPTVHVRDGIYCSSHSDVLLFDYQSHPAIKAPLSN